MYIFKNIQDEECIFYYPKCQISRPLKFQGQIDHIGQIDHSIIWSDAGMWYLKTRDSDYKD